MPPHQSNRAEVAGVADAIAVSSLETELLHRQIRHRRPIFGQANTTGGFPVSFRSSWTPPLPLPAPQRPPWLAAGGA
jgi:hypothetical protein